MDNSFCTFIETAKKIDCFIKVFSLLTIHTNFLDILLVLDSFFSSWIESKGGVQVGGGGGELRVG